MTEEDPERDEAMRQALFPHLTIEEYRELVSRQRRAFQALPMEEQERIRAKVQAAQDSNQEMAAWGKSVEVIRRASRRNP